MAEKRRSHWSETLTRWESVLLLVFLVDLFEDKVLFTSHEIPKWGQVLIKMAMVVGMFGVVLHFLNRRIEGGLSATRSLADKFILPRLLIHCAVLAAVFVGFYWIKIHKLPWQ